MNGRKPFEKKSIIEPHEAHLYIVMFISLNLWPL